MQTARTDTEIIEEILEGLRACFKKEDSLLLGDYFYSLHNGYDPIRLTQVLEEMDYLEQVLISLGDEDIKDCQKALSFSSKGISLTWIKLGDTAQPKIPLCNRNEVYLRPPSRSPWAIPISFFEEEVLRVLSEKNRHRDDEEILRLMTLQVVRKSDEEILKLMTSQVVRESDKDFFVRVGIE